MNSDGSHFFLTIKKINMYHFARFSADNIDTPFANYCSRILDPKNVSFFFQ